MKLFRLLPLVALFCLQLSYRGYAAASAAGPVIVGPGGVVSQNLTFTGTIDMSGATKIGIGGGSWGTIGGTLSNQTDLAAALAALVPTSRTVNSHALSSNVTVTPADLGLVIGTNVQAFNANLNGATAAGAALLSAGSASAQRTALSLVPGTDVQAYNANLNGATAAGAALLSAASASAQRTALSLAPGTDVQAYNANLNGATSAGNALLSAANAAAQRTALGVPSTSNLIKGDGSGGLTAATAGTDFFNATTFPGSVSQGKDLTQLSWTVLFEASRITPVADGTTITSWADSSGNGNTASQVAGSSTGITYRTAPNGINGRPVVHFSGAQNLITGNVASSTTLNYLAAVVRSTTNTEMCFVSGGLYQGVNGVRRALDYLSNNYIGFRGGGTADVTSTPNFPSGTVMFVEAFFTSTTLALYENGTLVYSGSPTGLASFSSAPINLGSFPNSPLAASGFYTGDIALVMAASTAPSGANLDYIRSYVVANYGVQLGAQTNTITQVPFYDAFGGMSAGTMLYQGGSSYWLKNSANTATFTVDGDISVPMVGGRYMTLVHGTSFEPVWTLYGQTGASGFCNLAIDGYSAIRFLDYTSHEHMAVGYGNPSSSPIFGSADYIEIWNTDVAGTRPPVYRLVSTGDYGTTGSGRRSYQIYSVEPGTGTTTQTGGTWTWWRRIPYVNGSEQVKGGSIDPETGRLDADNGIKLGAVHVSALPTASSGIKGTEFWVDDATSPTVSSTVTGGSSTWAKVVCNGSGWYVEFVMP